MGYKDDFMGSGARRFGRLLQNPFGIGGIPIIRTVDGLPKFVENRCLI
jgi:hypothetical protein